jgi:hypothetical protein
MLNKMKSYNLGGIVLLLSAMLGVANAQLPTLTPTPTSVPPGTEVIVKTVNAMNSKTAKTGDRFVVQVVSDVVVDQQVLIPAGTRGTGTIIFARAKHFGGVSGALDVRVDSLDTPNGLIKLKASDANRGKDRRNAGTAATLAFGVIGMLAVQGEEITLNAGTEINTVVATPRVLTTPVVTAVPIATSVTLPSPANAAVAAPSSDSPQENPEKKDNE